MTLLLAGDIGGTKTILWLADLQENGHLKPVYEFRYSSHDFPDLVPMVQEFLTAAASSTGQSLTPNLSCFAIAGPVVDDTSQLTNLGWSLTAERLSQELGIQQVRLINDFAAVGYGILGMTDSDLKSLQIGQFDPDAPIAVIGAGTGLGQGFLVRQGESYQVYPSEGGHADFAPRTELEFQLLKYLLDKHNIQRVSVERIVSGQGIVAIYQFLRDYLGKATEASAVGEAIRLWEREAVQNEKTIDPAAVIAKAALEQSDHLAEQTLDLFIGAYGAEAGNLALKLLPYGGLYIAGGIAAKVLPLLQSGAFMQAFLQKGRMRPLLEKVPVHIVLNPQVGLIGAAVCAARQLS